ncbi:hypothetical protein GCM10023156_61110 [Novipirellula rosea]|uniref:Uncharacterized protein n=1 Tax=Novipirellula rosea TaxID=1031540 RepID=A0ABP8NPL8_9BACT
MEWGDETKYPNKKFFSVSQGDWSGACFVRRIKSKSDFENQLIQGSNHASAQPQSG